MGEAGAVRGGNPGASTASLAPPQVQATCSRVQPRAVRRRRNRKAPTLPEVVGAGSGRRWALTEPLPEEAWRQQPREISDELVATLGACLAAVRSVTLAELAEATGVPISDVRLALRRLAEQLKVTGMQVLDDGSHVQLAPERRFHGAVAHLLQPEQQPRLSREQAEVLAS
jgi:Segregation and condensation complex subunit ScpB